MSLNRLHEFDTPGFFVQDMLQGLHPEGTGELFAHLLLSRLAGKQISFDAPAARLLALGAGRADAELAFAKKAHIPFSQISLLDKDFDPNTLQRLREISPEIDLIQRGIFEFLADPEARGDFSVVLLVGIEYIVRELEAAQVLIESLVSKITPGGIVVILPSGANMDSVWVRAGFEVIEPFKSWSNWVVYRWPDGTEQASSKSL